MCYPGVQCTDNPAPMSGASCGDCPTGFFGTGFICDDIDECENETDNCQQQCVNTEGSFLCECYSGYEFDSKGICQDIDECIVFNDCHQECINTVGSYQCSCIDGFVLETDNVSCIAKEMCTNNYTLPLLCGLLDGIEVFACVKGYTYDSNAVTCEDTNECLLSACEQNCSNTDGSFNCSCTSGYTLATDGRSCLDNDECLEAALNNQNLCDDSELCNNIPGSYMCVCPGGTEYNPISQMCKNINGSSSPTNSPSSTTTSPSDTMTPVKDPILSLQVIIGIAIGAAFVFFVFLIFIVFVLHTLYKKKSERSRKIRVLPRPAQDLTTPTKRDAPLRLVSMNTTPPHYVTD